MYVRVEEALPVEIYDLLRELGATTNTRAFFHTSYAIYLSMEQPEWLDRLMTKCLYPEVAKKCRSNKVTVEHNIRYLIQSVWKRNPCLLCTLAGKPLHKRPTPKQFLVIISTYLVT